MIRPSTPAIPGLSQRATKGDRALPPLKLGIRGLRRKRYNCEAGCALSRPDRIHTAEKLAKIIALLVTTVLSVVTACSGTNTSTFSTEAHSVQHAAEHSGLPLR